MAKTQEGRVVGIDLGTTYSVVAHVNEHGDPQILPNLDNQRTTPSVIYIAGDMAVVGAIAKDQSQMGLADTIQFIKPTIGRKRTMFELSGESWSAEELSALILRKLVKDAEQVMGEGQPVTHAVITVPAFFTEQQRKSTEDAGRIAGLEVMSIINEPTAAALAYGYDALGQDRTVLVFDLGGGTFDVTLMRLEGHNIRMLATDGDVQLGGRDWDQRVIDEIVEAVAQRHGEDLSRVPEAINALFGAVEQAKLRLTKLPQTRIPIHYNGINDHFDLSRGMFEELTEDLVAQTETTLRLVVEEAGLGFGQIDEVLLVGGSTRMPAVRGMIQRLTGLEPRHLINPDECVALGAAIHAVMKQIEGIGAGRPMPPLGIGEAALGRFQSIEEQLINAHTLGLLALDEQGQRMVAPIIPRHAHIPRREKRIFQTSSDGQQRIRLTVMEGESRDPRACNELGTCMVRGLPPGVARGTPIEVSFACSADGQLNVEATLPTLSEKVEAVIERTLGLDDEAIATAQRRIAAMRIE